MRKTSAFIFIMIGCPSYLRRLFIVNTYLIRKTWNEKYKPRKRKKVTPKKFPKPSTPLFLKSAVEEHSYIPKQTRSETVFSNYCYKLKVIIEDHFKRIPSTIVEIGCKGNAHIIGSTGVLWEITVKLKGKFSVKIFKINLPISLGDLIELLRTVSAEWEALQRMYEHLDSLNMDPKNLDL